MEQKKYEFTKETMCFDGVTLHRIQALKDFGNVDAGELGGWVESEKNLSQSGDCWIAMEAKAYGGAETGEELIKKAYQDSEKSGREYERVVRYVESILADEQKE